MNLQDSIDSTLAQVEQGTLNASSFFKSLSTSQPEIFTFFFDEDTRLLHENEHDYLLFLAMTILTTLRGNALDFDAIDIESLEDMSEHNWGLIELTSIENITETVSKHPGFALYEFLEDACTPVKEHDILSESAVELVYVKCKSLVDCAFLIT